MTSILLKKVLESEESDEAWFEGLLRWVLDGDPRGGLGSPRTRRLEELREHLEMDPRGAEWRARIQRVWGHTSAVGLLADAGLPRHAAFLREALELLLDRFLPSLDAEDDLSALLHRLDLDERDGDWLETLPESQGLWRELFAVPAAVQWDAVQLLALRTAALGLSRDLRALGPDERELDSPFARLPDLAAALRQGLDRGWRGALETCRARLRTSLEHLDSHGSSTELVYRLDLLEAHLDRMAELVELLEGRLDGKAFAAELVRRKARARRLGTLLRGSVRLMARKVVEHAGETGEHYIAMTREEWRRTFGSAAGGGVLTTATAFGKFIVAAADLAPMMAGLGFALNYAASFIAMQFCHFTLSSKQPAMTAATLAGALEDNHSRLDLRDRVAGIVRSQTMATLGNVLVTLPVTAAAGLAYRLIMGRPFVPRAKALHTLQDMNPLFSKTILFAIFTGAMLWLSSLAAGWAANWSAYRRLPQALASHRRVRWWLGPDRARWLGRMVEQHISGVVGYLALGFLLGFLPVALAFMGLHVEVRHVTLSAATLALSAVQDQPPWWDVLWALAGIAVIGACNFGVSFYLALRTAMRARGVPAQERLGAWLWRQFRKDPWLFLGPPRAPEDPQAPRTL